MLAVAVTWELWAEIDHRATLTKAMRDLSLGARVVVLLVGLGLLVHLVIPERWATEHDPIDRMEHRLHRWVEK